MTEVDTTEPVVRPLAWRHPAERRSAGPRAGAVPANVADAVDESGHGVDGDGVDGAGIDGGDAVVLDLNDAASIYRALADEIEGSAVGWSAAALAQLEQGLLQRYGALVGGRQPVRRLVRLAARPVAS